MSYDVYISRHFALGVSININIKIEKFGHSLGTVFERGSVEQRSLLMVYMNKISMIKKFINENISEIYTVKEAI